MAFRLSQRWNHANRTGGTIHFQKLPIMERFRCPAGADDGGDVILTRDDRAVAQHAPRVGDDRRSISACIIPMPAAHTPKATAVLGMWTAACTAAISSGEVTTLFAPKVGCSQALIRAPPNTAPRVEPVAVANAHCGQAILLAFRR